MIIKINKNILWIGSIALLIIVGITITIISNPGDEVSSSNSNTANTISSSVNSLNSSVNNSTPSRQQTATMGAVTVDIEPITLGVTEEKSIFSVAFNTHSVELDFDFTEIIVLEDDLGNAYKALEWTGNSGWHHVSGDIIFPQINANASQVIVTINEIEGQSKTFTWDING